MPGQGGHCRTEEEAVVSSFKRASPRYEEGRGCLSRERRRAAGVAAGGEGLGPAPACDAANVNPAEQGVE